ncbi:hypothetical protein Tco_0058879 [Tanacetum coccineum]
MEDMLPLGEEPEEEELLLGKGTLKTVTILNTLDHLCKFDGKSDDGFFVGYSLTSKAFRVNNIRTRKVEENLHIRFLENKPIVTGDGPKWADEMIVYKIRELMLLDVACTEHTIILHGSEESKVQVTLQKTEFRPTTL